MFWMCSLNWMLERRVELLSNLAGLDRVVQLASALGHGN